MTSTPYHVPFRVDKENESLCRKTLTKADLKKFRKAVEEDYYFQMFYDDLPIWGFVGKIEKILKPNANAEMRYYLFTHVHFDVSYNGDKVVEINVSTDPLRTVDITDDAGAGEKTVEFSYRYALGLFQIQAHCFTEAGDCSVCPYIAQYMTDTFFYSSQRSVERNAHPVRSPDGKVQPVLVFAAAPGDSLVFHYQQLRHRSFAHRIPSHDSDAGFEKRLHQVHHRPRRRGRSFRRERRNRVEVHPRRRVSLSAVHLAVLRRDRGWNAAVRDDHGGVLLGADRGVLPVQQGRAAHRYSRGIRPDVR